MALTEEWFDHANPGLEEPHGGGTYSLRCDVCSFGAMAASVDEAFDVFESHCEHYGRHHFVNIEKVEPV